MRTLDELGLTENTLIVLTSDNGPVIDDGYADQAEEKLNGHRPAGPYRGYKYSAFEGGTAVPMIVSWPARVASRQQSDALVSQVDLLASLGSLVQARLPKGSAPDSQNQLNALMGVDTVGRAYVIEQSSEHVLSVRTHRWKYIEPNDGPAMVTWAPQIETGNLPEPQLYDMTKSLYEHKNVATKYPEITRELKGILSNERQRTVKK